MTITTQPERSELIFPQSDVNTADSPGESGLAGREVLADHNTISAHMITQGNGAKNVLLFIVRTFYLLQNNANFRFKIKKFLFTAEMIVDKAGKRGIMVIKLQQWSRDGRKFLGRFRVDNKFGSVIRIDVKPLVSFRWGFHLDQVASIVNPA